MRSDRPTLLETSLVRVAASDRRRRRLGRACLLGVGLPLGLWSCGPGEREGGFVAAQPAARVDAIDAAAVAWRNDPTRPVPLEVRQGLVESLRSDDELVRFLAIETLADMTGQRRGYRYDDEEAIRLVAIEEWVAWAGGPVAAPAAASPSAAQGANPG